MGTIRIVGVGRVGTACFVAKTMTATTAIMSMMRMMAVTAIAVAATTSQPNLPHRYLHHRLRQKNVPMTKAFGFANENEWIVDGLENDPTSDARESTRTNGCGSIAPMPVTNVESVK